MSFVPRVHEIYKHFKGDLYQITAIAEHTETGEQLVVYQAMYGEFKTYARPLSMFVSRVDKEKYPDVEQQFRFALQGPEADRQKRECGAPEVPQRVEPEAADAAKAGAADMVKADAAKAGAADMVKADAAKAGAADMVKADAAKAGAADMVKADVADAEKPDTADAEAAEESAGLDPMILEFLDSDSYVQKLNILAGLHHRITDEMITTMAIACDVEVADGDIEERYESLKGCLMTLERYECNRLR